MSATITDLDTSEAVVPGMRGGRLVIAVVRRVGELLLVAAVVVTLTTLLIQLAPGDPARIILGVRAPAEQVEALRRQLGLDQSVLQQLGDAFGRLIRGDLGTSIVNQGQSVSGVISAAAPVTATVIVGALLVSVLVGVPLGLASAVSPRRILRTGLSVLALALLAVPPFVLALLLLFGVALGLGLAPAGGWGSGFIENLRYAWLPSLALAGLVLPQILRTVRQTASAVMADDFVEAAEARGLSSARVIVRHIFPNCLLPVLAVLGLNAAALIAGAVVVEAVFGLPGLGGALQDAVQNRDYPVIQGIAVVTALAVILVNALVDLLAALLDPRVRVGR